MGFKSYMSFWLSLYLTSQELPHTQGKDPICVWTGASGHCPKGNRVLITSVMSGLCPNRIDEQSMTLDLCTLSESYGVCCLICGGSDGTPIKLPCKRLNGNFCQKVNCSSHTAHGQKPDEKATARTSVIEFQMRTKTATLPVLPEVTSSSTLTLTQSSGVSTTLISASCEKSTDVAVTVITAGVVTCVALVTCLVSVYIWKRRPTQMSRRSFRKDAPSVLPNSNSGLTNPLFHVDLQTRQDQSGGLEDGTEMLTYNTAGSYLTPIFWPTRQPDSQFTGMDHGTDLRSFNTGEEDDGYCTPFSDQNPLYEVLGERETVADQHPKCCRPETGPILECDSSNSHIRE
ncbi:uncharacterized protein LOC135462244 [Liolophura sinensis]|uniref:uncharacterized protein LOC135462244 n=1 Tax=Liolophura sinensis TaxID=3198878 RepID=UPI0031588913